MPAREQGEAEPVPLRLAAQGTAAQLLVAAGQQIGVIGAGLIGHFWGGAGGEAPAPPERGWTLRPKRSATSATTM